jgi:hypothetical protein
VKTFEQLAQKIALDREEAQVIQREYAAGISDPGRFAAKQEMKQKHKRVNKR